MRSRTACAILVAFLGIFVLAFTSHAEVTVTPVGMTAALDAGGNADQTLTLTNGLNQEVPYKVKFQKVDRGQRQGPRRDEVDIDGMMFAVFQTNSIWGWLDDGMRNDPQLDEDNMISYRDANAWNDVDFSEYNVICVSAYQQQFNQQYANNLERFEEYIDGGGCAYFETGNTNAAIRSPGGIYNDVNGGAGNGQLIVSPDPEDEDYSLFAEICHSTQENNWERGEVIEGNSWLHSTYSAQQFDDGVEDGTLEWYQPIASVQNNENSWGAIAYGYGSGVVLTVGHPSAHCWFNWDDPGQWGSIGAEILFYLTEMAGPKWITVEPNEGALAANDDAELTFSITTEGLEDGVYEQWVNFEFPDNEALNIQMSAVLSVGDPAFSIRGDVTDAETGETVSGATAALDFYIVERFSNDNGAYAIDNLPPGNYNVTFTCPDYLPTTRAVEIGQNDVELDVRLLHSECNLSTDAVEMSLAPDTETDVDFSITNDGNGPLTFTSERRLLGDANAAPWEVRRIINLGATLEDDRIEGVAFDGENFYLAGANGADSSTIYVVNRDGEQLRSFEQLTHTRYGMKDLEWDGELLWGSGETRVYGFNTDGESAVEFNGPFNPTNNIGYDPENEILWLSGTTTNIAGYDRDGNALNLVLNRKGLRIYGLCYWPDDPDGYNLYILNQPAGGGIFVHKMNTANGDTLLACRLPEDANVGPAGTFICNTYDVYSWVMMTMENIAAANGGDRLSIYQLDARKDWMSVTPTEGVIEAGVEQDFVLNLNAAGLPAVLFEGEIVFTHDGVGGETHLPVSLDVVEGPVQAVRNVQLEMGWNMVSTNLQPDEADFAVLSRPLVDAGILRMIKDDRGHFMAPAPNQFNNLDPWAVSKGYLVKVTEPAVLRLEGMSVMADEPLHLTQGWQMIAYYPRRAVNVVVALSGIRDQLQVAKNGYGNFYIPSYNFNNIGDMREGQGYQVRVTEAVDLVYQMQGQDRDAVAYRSIQDYPGRYPLHPLTGVNMSLLVEAPGLDGEIGIYANGKLVGTGLLDRGRAGVAVWGDDPSTVERDGAVDGEALEVRLQDGRGERCLEATVLTGELTYRTDGLAVVRAEEGSSPETFGLTGVYPNPFNGRATVRVTLSEAGKLQLALYDLGGRMILEAATGRFEAGSHSIAIDAGELASGVYLLRLNAGGKTSQMKVALVK